MACKGAWRACHPIGHWMANVGRVTASSTTRTALLYVRRAMSDIGWVQALRICVRYRGANLLISWDTDALNAMIRIWHTISPLSRPQLWACRDAWLRIANYTITKHTNVWDAISSTTSSMETAYLRIASPRELHNAVNVSMDGRPTLREIVCYTTVYNTTVNRSVKHALLWRGCIRAHA